MKLGSLRFKPIFTGLMLFILLFGLVFLITTYDTDDHDNHDDGKTQTSSQANLIPLLF